MDVQKYPIWSICKDSEGYFLIISPAIIDKELIAIRFTTTPYHKNHSRYAVYINNQNYHLMLDKIYYISTDNKIENQGCISLNFSFDIINQVLRQTTARIYGFIADDYPLFSPIFNTIESDKPQLSETQEDVSQIEEDHSIDVEEYEPLILAQNGSSLNLSESKLQEIFTSFAKRGEDLIPSDKKELKEITKSDYITNKICAIKENLLSNREFVYALLNSDNDKDFIWQCSNSSCEVISNIFMSAIKDGIMSQRDIRVIQYFKKIMRIRRRK